MKNEVLTTLLALGIPVFTALSAWIVNWLKNKQLELANKKTVDIEIQKAIAEKQVEIEKVRYNNDVVLNGMVADKMLVAQKLFTDNAKRLQYVLSYVRDCLGRDFHDATEKQTYIDKITRIKNQYNDMHDIKNAQDKDDK